MSIWCGIRLEKKHGINTMILNQRSLGSRKNESFCSMKSEYKINQKIGGIWNFIKSILYWIYNLHPVVLIPTFNWMPCQNYSLNFFTSACQATVQYNWIFQMLDILYVWNIFLNNQLEFDLPFVWMYDFRIYDNFLCLIFELIDKFILLELGPTMTS